MKKYLQFFFAPIFIFSCASTYTIDSVPSDAKISIENQQKGDTPYTNYDEKVWLWSKHTVLLEKPGFQPKEFTLKPTKWIGQRVVLGIIFPPALLWAQTFPELTTVRLEPADTYTYTPAEMSENESTQ